MYESISKNNELENEMSLDMSYFWYSDDVVPIKNQACIWLTELLKVKMLLHFCTQTNMICDNEVVVRNLTMPVSTLKKKHFIICYHCVQEACALDMNQIEKGRWSYKSTWLIDNKFTWSTIVRFHWTDTLLI